MAGCKCEVVDENVLKAITGGGDLRENLKKSRWHITAATGELKRGLDRVEDNPICFACVVRLLAKLDRVTEHEETPKQKFRKRGKRISLVRQNGKSQSKRLETVNVIPGRTPGVKTG